MSAAQGTNPWATVLDRLSADHAMLVNNFLHRLSDAHLYDGYEIAEEDLRQAASDTIEMLIRQIGGVPLPLHLADLPARLGRRRARQGIPRENLIEAIRLDFRVLWAGLLRANEGRPAEVLVLHTEELLSAVETYLSEVQAAYLDEQADLNRDSRAQMMRALSRLLCAGDDADRVADEVAQTLKFRPTADFEVASVSVTEADRARRLVAARGARSHFVSWDFEDGTVFVRERAADLSWAETLEAVAGGLVDGVAGLRNVPRAVGLARAVARYAGLAGPGLSTDADVWPCIASEHLSPLLPRLNSQVLAALQHMPAPDRDRILDTVLQFCTNGSIKDTAEQAYCHRNTIVNRLLRFRELTGLDVVIPADAAQALIAIGRPLPPRGREATRRFP